MRHGRCHDRESASSRPRCKGVQNQANRPLTQRRESQDTGLVPCARQSAQVRSGLIENFLGKLKEFKRWIEARIRGSFSFALSFQKALAKKRRGQKAPRTGLRSTPLFHSPTMALACLRSASSSVTPCSAAALGLSMSWAAPVALAMAPGCSPLRMRSAMRPAWRPIS